MNRQALVSLERLIALDREIDRISRSHFPHESSRVYLGVLKDEVSALKLQLSEAVSQGDETQLRRKSKDIQSSLYHLLPFVGIAQRSSSLRIAFEIYEPLQDLCMALLAGCGEHRTSSFRLVLSSEWDYSPTLYPNKGKFLDFIFLGLPV